MRRGMRLTGFIPNRSVDRPPFARRTLSGHRPPHPGRPESAPNGTDRSTTSYPPWPTNSHPTMGYVGDPPIAVSPAFSSWRRGAYPPQDSHPQMLVPGVTDAP